MTLDYAALGACFMFIVTLAALVELWGALR